MVSIASILSNEVFSPLDREFARFLVRRYTADDDVQLAGAMLSEALRNGHTCIDLDTVCGNLYGCEPLIAVPHPNNLRTRLSLSSAVGRADDRRPLVLDGKQLSLHRIFTMEQRLADEIRLRTNPVPYDIHERVMALAKKLFGKTGCDLSLTGGDLQAAGAFLPFLFKVSIISGGPGTGKTTVLAKILALQCADAEAQNRPLPVVALCAPTGKAAQRMAESLIKSAHDMVDVLPDAHREYFGSLTPKTVHRLLGIGRSGAPPRHNRENPIEADIVVVDESSMVDLGLMDALVSALPKSATLILLGDRNQLPSVDAGRVFADLCSMAPVNTFSAEYASLVNSVIADSCNHCPSVNMRLSPVVELRHSFRFRGDEAIGVVSQAVNAGDADGAYSALLSNHAGVSTCRLESHIDRSQIIDRIRDLFSPLLQAQTPRDALAAISRFMVLTVTNEGPLGREGINAAMTGEGEPRVYPIMVVENDPMLDLYNGDIGIVFREGEAVRAWFSDGADALRPFITAQLPPHVCAFAITVHKSQGSEFEEIFCLLPNEREGEQLLSRELLYTAITRAKKRCTLFGDENSVRGAIGRKNERMSGLLDKLTK